MVLGLNGIIGVIGVIEEDLRMRQIDVDLRIS